MFKLLIHPDLVVFSLNYKTILNGRAMAAITVIFGNGYHPGLLRT